MCVKLSQPQGACIMSTFIYFSFIIGYRNYLSSFWNSLLALNIAPSFLYPLMVKSRQFELAWFQKIRYKSFTESWLECSAGCDNGHFRVQMENRPFWTFRLNSTFIYCINFRRQKIINFRYRRCIESKYKLSTYQRLAKSLMSLRGSDNSL